MFYRKKKGLLAAGCLFLMMVCSGCGDGSEKVTEGMQLIADLQYEDALEVFNTAGELHENERLIARGKGIAYMGLADYEQAITCFKEALASSGGLVEEIDYDINYYLAAAYAKSGRYADAEKTYDAILALRHKETDAYFLRGNMRLALSDYEGAKADFDAVIAAEPRNYDRLITIYEVLERYGYKEAGQEYLNQALGAGEKQMNAYDSGRIYYYLGEYQKAYLALEEARSKGGAESYLYLGKAYEATGDYNYAASVYNSYIGKEGGNAEVYNQLGLCELKKQDYQKALEAFQAGMSLEDDGFKQSLAFNEIVAYEYLGNYTKALELIEAYLKNYPDDEVAIREQQFLSTR